MIRVPLNSDFPGGIVQQVVSKDEFVLLRRELITCDRGFEFFDRIEKISTYVPALPSGRIDFGMVKTMLAIFNSDKTVDIHLNELVVIAEMQKKWGEIKAGQPVLVDQISDVRRIKFPHVSIPLTCGIILVLSYGWRKMLFWDFTGLPPDSNARDYDLELVLGQGYSQLVFAEMCNISDDKLSEMVKAGWFPFIGLGIDLRNELTNSIDQDFDKDAFGDKVGTYYEELLDEKITSWTSEPRFVPHMPFIASSVRSYKSGDYLAAISTILPRIEGILRDCQTNASWSIKSADLIGQVIPGHLRTQSGFSPFLPHKFVEFVDQVIFKRFDGAAYLAVRHDPGMGRHTVAHGVAPSAHFDKATALKLYLTIDQIYYLLRADTTNVTKASGT